MPYGHFPPNNAVPTDVIVVEHNLNKHAVCIWCLEKKPTWKNCSKAPAHLRKAATERHEERKRQNAAIWKSIR